MKQLNEKLLKQKYHSKIQSCKDQGIHFDLSLKAFKKLITKKKCQYTGKLFSENVGRSIDRVDNTKGYVKGNCVACCSHLNGIKSNIDYKDIISMAKFLKKFKKKKK